MASCSRPPRPADGWCWNKGNCAGQPRRSARNAPQTVQAVGTASRHEQTDQKKAGEMPFPCRGLREDELEDLADACEARDPHRPFRGLSAHEDVGGLISMMVPSTACSNQRPDTLMQDRKADRSMTKRTARAIQVVCVSLRVALNVRLSCETRESRRGHTTCRAILRCRLNPGSHRFAIAHFDSCSLRGPLPIRPIRCKLPRSAGWSTISPAVPWLWG
jgi:hypothetical protein